MEIGRAKKRQMGGHGLSPRCHTLAKGLPMRSPKLSSRFGAEARRMRANWQLRLQMLPSHDDESKPYFADYTRAARLALQPLSLGHDAAENEQYLDVARARRRF